MRARITPSSLPRRFVAAETGVAAVEFAFIAPILILLWLGGVEVTQALSLDRRLSALVGSVGDLVSRSKMVTEADVASILEVTPGVVYPFDGGAADVVLTAVDIDTDGNAKVAWSRSMGSRAAHPTGANMSEAVTDDLRRPGSQLIMAEAYYAYRPAVGYVITGSLTLEKRLLFVPRVSPRVKLCTDATETDCS